MTARSRRRRSGGATCDSCTALENYFEIENCSVIVTFTMENMKTLSKIVFLNKGAGRFKQIKRYMFVALQLSLYTSMNSWINKTVPETEK